MLSKRPRLIRSPVSSISACTWPSSPRAICLGCLLHTLKISYRCRDPSKGKDQTSRKLASCQPIDWREILCEERQRSHSAVHANHFGDEDMEINGSVRPGPEMF
ncbi:hypothetical protein CEXT_62001 [Caerostris extrusa]|uniref:Uncharacterized protein n=1 Tax=Caerostris extrusa TaxID=172846 RepID=A0AAV4R7W3_CAEEX|nr:hypothetical protein CEXT_62001 [Caerostris extrusa]